MADKDLTEKILEDYNDVFSDIINATIFNGEQRVLPDTLQDISVHSQYKANDDSIHELERDVLKLWSAYDVELAICGLENQTKAEKICLFV